ncbi:MAG: hypothetical protein H5U02_06375 [Clostridia bacterium]|nr:hypothetical protein [Clostridia bacterium]
MTSRFVFFDLDGTLYDFPACAEEALTETLTQASREFDLSPEAIPLVSLLQLDSGGETCDAGSGQGPRNLR